MSGRKELRIIQWDECPPTWRKAVGNGHKYGHALALILSVEQREALRMLIRDFLRSVPIEKRFSPIYFLLHGVHSGLNGILCDSATTILSARFQDLDGLDYSMDEQTAAAIEANFPGPHE